jgi:thymidine phosphorylase
VDYLTGRKREAHFHAVTLSLGAEMLVLGGLAPNRAEAQARMEEAIASGRAAETFARMVAALGGPSDLLDKPDTHLARAPVTRAVLPGRSGIVTRIETRNLGLAVVALGGGRARPDDAIDHAVGLTDLAGLGQGVGPDRPLAVVHARDERGAESAAAAIRAAYTLSETGPQSGPLILDRIGTA